MGRTGGWGGRLAGVEGWLGRKGAWGGREAGAEGNMGRKGVWGGREYGALGTSRHHPPLAPSSYDISQPAGRHLPYNNNFRRQLLRVWAMVCDGLLLRCASCVLLLAATSNANSFTAEPDHPYRASPVASPVASRVVLPQATRPLRSGTIGETGRYSCRATAAPMRATALHWALPRSIFRR